MRNDDVSNPSEASDESSGYVAVDGEIVQEIYRKYTQGLYYVNRRYQRKLVWKKEQKERLIDSIVQGMPIPLVLLSSEATVSPKVAKQEIIDGLQRLHAIISFIDNDFSYEGKYFDLDILATSKKRKEDPKDPLKQKFPILDAEACVAIANYKLPTSNYSANDSLLVDEVFRRINSTGRQLSRQEVRQAGITCALASIVRKISANVRGDGTRAQTLPLEGISEISMKSRDEEGPGVVIDDIFWVREGVLIRDNLRGSLDEQLILDLVLDILEIKESVSTKTRNDSYEVDSEIGGKVDAKIRQRGEAYVYETFEAIMEVIETLVTHVRKEVGSGSLMAFLGHNPNNSVGRYFHVLFVAIGRLLRDGKEMVDIQEFADALDGYWASKDERLPSGSDWKYPDRSREITRLRRQVSDAFVESTDVALLAHRDMSEKFKRETHSYLMEAPFFELKVGLLEHSPDKRGDRGKQASRILDKILKTATAMANMGTDVEGSIYIGVADSEADVSHLSNLYSIDAMDYDPTGYAIPFKIVGIEYELDLLRESLDEYVMRITRHFRKSDKVDDREFREALVSGVKPILVSGREDVRQLIGIKVRSVGRLVEYDGTYFERSGTECVELKGAKLLAKGKEFG